MESAVRLVGEIGRPVAQVAGDLGINEGTLGNWVNEDKRRRGDGNGKLSEDRRAAPALLRRENVSGQGFGFSLREPDRDL
jgi:transposase